MQELMMIRTNQGLVPATEHDHALMRASYKVGQAVKTTVKQQSSRSLQHHKLYFGGLIGLVKDYWEPQTGLTNPVEAKTAQAFCGYLRSTGINLTDANIDALVSGYLQNLSNRRAAKMINPVPASALEIHRWIKLECGYFDLIRNPDGSLERKPKSISFAKMSQSEFNEFFKLAFGVCWRFVLSGHFDTEADAENAINRMLDIAA